MKDYEKILKNAALPEPSANFDNKMKELFKDALTTRQSNYAMRRFIYASAACFAILGICIELLYPDRENTPINSNPHTIFIKVDAEVAAIFNTEVDTRGFFEREVTKIEHFAINTIIK